MTDNQEPLTEAELDALKAEIETASHDPVLAGSSLVSHRKLLRLIAAARRPVEGGGSERDRFEAFAERDLMDLAPQEFEERNDENGHYYQSDWSNAAFVGWRAKADQLASSAPQRSGEWRAIDSAPKDGTPILAWCVHPHARYAEDDKEWACPVITQWTTFNGGGWTWHGMVGQFTHWMPLPAAPGETPPARPTERSDS